MRLVALALITGLSAPACTLGAMGATGGTIAIHNTVADSEDRWSYTEPLLVSAAVGLAIDIAFLYWMGKQWSKPMT